MIYKTVFWLGLSTLIIVGAACIDQELFAPGGMFWMFAIVAAIWFKEDGL